MIPASKLWRVMTFLSLALAYSTWAAPPLLPAVKPGDLKPVETKRTLQDYVSAALNQAFDQIGQGGLGDQKALFESEVLADPLAFVLNYRTSSEGTEVKVDREKMRNFLRFSSTLFSTSPTSNRICVVVRPADACAICDALRSPVQSTLTMRFERRGFVNRSTIQVPEGAALSGDKAFDYYVSRMGEAMCGGVLFTEIMSDGVANNDEGNSTSDLRVRSNTYFLAKDSSGRKIKGHVESVIQAGNEDTDAARQVQANLLVARQMLELFPAVAAQTSGLPGRQDVEERYLRIEGLSNFGDYVRFKQAVLNAIPNLSLEERFISPGTFEFALGGEGKLGDLGRQIEKISWELKSLKVVGGGGNQLVVVLK